MSLPKLILFSILSIFLLTSQCKAINHYQEFFDTLFLSNEEQAKTLKFNQGDNYCNIPGVHCNEAQDVVKILFPKYQLEGVLPSLEKFTELTHLDISFNSLDGELEVDKCTKLVQLFAQHNKLSGPINFARFPHLKYLDLEFNRFADNLESVFQLSELVVVNLSRNQFTSNKVSFSKWSKVVYLNLSYNLLKGDLFTLPSLTNVAHLNLALNQFTGSLPAKNFSQKSLLHIDLYGNQIDLGTDLKRIDSYQSLVFCNVYQSVGGETLLQHGACQYNPSTSVLLTSIYRFSSYSTLLVSMCIMFLLKL